VAKSDMGNSGDPQQVAICLAELWLWLKSKWASSYYISLHGKYSTSCLCISSKPCEGPWADWKSRKSYGWSGNE